jgi:OmcA/MtrC family decaheme c-type cytochrome
VDVPLGTLDDAALLRLSREGALSLTLAEMQTIQAHFRALDREPTACELETLAQTWSEHCKHKTLTGLIEFTPPGGGPVQRIDNLLKSTIARATHELARPMAVGIEGYRTRNLMRSDGSLFGVREAGLNDVFYFASDGGEPDPRRQVVATDNCNRCHGNLSVHGDNRNDTRMCVLCHNPMTTDVARRPVDAGAAESVHFATMIHKIHSGEDLDGDYSVYGFGGTAHEFAGVRVPGDRRNCATCHVNGSQNIPVPSGTLPVLSPRGPVSPLPPNSAACLGCHTSLDALVHTTLQSNALGEACGVCHGPNREFSVERAHAR